MKRLRRTLVVAIVGMAILGFGLISAVEAVRPPPYEDAVHIAYWQDTTICESDASFYIIGWYWYIDEVDNEWKEFPVPLKAELEIDSVEIKLSRTAVGRGNLPPNIADNSKQGPLYVWYAYFEPYYFEPTVEGYTVRNFMSYKNPDSPSERIEWVWDVTLFVNAE